MNNISRQLFIQEIFVTKTQPNYKFSVFVKSYPSRENLKSFMNHNIAVVFWCKVVSLRTASKVKRKERKEICTKKIHAAVQR